MAKGKYVVVWARGPILEDAYDALMLKLLHVVDGED